MSSTTASSPNRIRLKTPRELYMLWERQHWQSQAIDFTQDKEDWKLFPDLARDFLIWNMATFFVGEERVATAFAPIVMSAEDADEESYLATQQVDEIRHMQFFDRFWREVVEDGTEDLSERLDRVRESCNAASIEFFDDHLMSAVDRLRVAPDDLEAKIRAVTIYHMVAEGTIALTGQHFITDFITRAGVLPGFAEGFNNVERDEHRHVGYGTWLLQEKCSRHPELVDVVHDTLREMLPIAARVLTPPGMEGRGEYVTPAGTPSAEINRFAITALGRRLRVVGIGLPPVSNRPAAVSH